MQLDSRKLVSGNIGAIHFYLPVSVISLFARHGFRIGLISYGAVGVVLAQLFTMAQGYYNNVPTFALQNHRPARFGQAIGIIAGAITFRLTFLLLPKLGVIPK
ncbi:MAG: DUF2523 domain-containing protein [Nitrosomonas sp.]|nr:DUF2523 domain-containing protein [Nitrosomonas sp.]